jgi:hypothetical protein
MTTEEAKTKYGKDYVFECLTTMERVMEVLSTDAIPIYLDDVVASLKIGGWGLELTLAPESDERGQLSYALEFEIMRRDDDGEWQNHKVLGRNAVIDFEDAERMMLYVLTSFAAANGIAL